ncbi:MAG: isoleucine--tRNA ligase [Patescibacteria group bacterium]
MFKEVNSNMNLPEIERAILKFWDENKIFEKSIENRADKPLYSFYDGPPFATGSPHYGHILVSAMKDAVLRYWTMKGYKIPRRWGWDCHGLPIENIAEKELGITHKKQIEEMGVKKFNDVCRGKIMEYVSEWEKVIPRLGRWVDMKNSYKTMDLPYMESVWWTFKELWDKDLIYEGYRVMYICPRCETTLSQSEVSEGYRTVKDLSVVVKLELTDEPGTFVLAWTTTPWTLIGNVALAVGDNINYQKVELTDPESGQIEQYILAKERVENILTGQNYRVSEEMKGVDLVGKRYKPLFNYYSNDENQKNKENGWKIYTADFVTTKEGTGVVHIAPAFGEDDMNLGKEKHLPFIQHIGMDGIIKSEAIEFAGMHVKPIDDGTKTDVEIIKYLAAKDLLFAKEKYEHSYPHCWRCDTPLINYATGSWFVKVTGIKDEAIKLAKEINWSPTHIKEGRFGKWLEGARDWSISRQRYWASVIPVWKCQKCSDLIAFGSIADLKQKSGQEILDLHKDAMDDVSFDCEKCDGIMKRIPDVLDTWFDSGSMPYAQIHYPFENQEKFENSFPAEFIAEAVDQTRAWFYYLHVIAASIKDKIAFKNVIVNGIVLAEDGKKMAKRLHNYPDPMEVMDKYGADILRQYLLSSPVVAAENINFSEKELAELQRGMFRMIWNSYSFFVLYANIDKWDANIERPTPDARRLTNVLDRWILSELNILITNLNKSMKKYELMQSTRHFTAFVDNLSNWYIRRSRKRFWKSENDSDKSDAYKTLHYVLVQLSKSMAPFTPFLSDEVYKNLTGEESVHLQDYPKADATLIDQRLNGQMNLVRDIVEKGLSARAEAKIKVRQPLGELFYGGEKLDPELENIIAEEVNIKKIVWQENISDVRLNTEISQDLQEEGIAREIIRDIQNLRKTTGYKVEDRITVLYETDSKILNTVLQKLNSNIKREVLADNIEKQKYEVDGQENYSVYGEMIWIGVKK